MGLCGASKIAALPLPALAATGMAVVVPRHSGSSSLCGPCALQKHSSSHIATLLIKVIVSRKGAMKGSADFLSTSAVLPVFDGP